MDEIKKGHDEFEQRIAERTAQLQQERNFVSAVLDAIGALVVVLDRQGRIVRFNQACQQLTNYTFADVKGQCIWDLLLLAEEVDPVKVMFRHLCAGHFPNEHEYHWVARDGARHLIAWSNTVLLNPEGAIEYIIGTGLDITERKQAQEVLQTYARVLESMVEGVNVTDESGIIYLTNPAFDAMFGYEPGELTGQHVSVLEINSPGEKPQFVDEINEQLQTKGVWFGEFRNCKKDGTPFITSARISILEMPDKRYRVSVQEDITARRWAEEEKTRLLEAVSRQREQLRALTKRTTEIQETERKQLARELHDQVGQNLTALGLNLNIIRAQTPSDSAAAALLQERINDSLMLTEQMTERIRYVMANLHPPVLDDYGIVPALRWYARQFGSRVNFTITVQAEEPIPRLAASVENALFRIAQEALTNVAKHAQASQVTICIEIDEAVIRLIVIDDGLGFEPASLAESTKRQGWGLLSITERAEAIRGQCRIVSSPERGTQVIVEVGQ